MKQSIRSIITIAFLSSSIAAVQLTRIDSVTVDSVWNTDTSVDGNVTQQRDVLLSFKPVADDSVYCVVDLSCDSGKTWGSNRSYFDGIGGYASFRAAPNIKKSIHLRVFAGDTAGIVFRVTARSDTLSIGRFRIVNASDGWSESDSSYYYYRTWRDLAQKVDGYFMPFTYNGMVEGFTDNLIKADSFFCTQYIMEFGTNERAGKVFAAQKPQTTLVSLAFPDSVAIGKRVLGGLLAYAHFRHFYFEISLTGYTVQDTAVAHANTLLNYYKQKSGL